MGFGILFFGYFLAFGFSLSKVYFFADIIGTLIMLYAFTRLTQYNTYYKSAFGVGVSFILLCGGSAVSIVKPIYESEGTVALCVNGLKLVMACVMLVIVFLGARGISGGAGDERLVKNAERQIVMTAVYYVVALGVLAVSPFLDDATAYVSFVLLIYYYVMFVLNLVCIYKCFATLCPADEDENETSDYSYSSSNNVKVKDSVKQYLKEKNIYGELDTCITDSISDLPIMKVCRKSIIISKHRHQNWLDKGMDEIIWE